MNQEDVSKVMRAQGRKGGMARNKRLTPEQRSEVGRMLAAKRWRREKTNEALHLEALGMGPKAKAPDTKRKASPEPKAGTDAARLLAELRGQQDNNGRTPGYLAANLRIGVEEARNGLSGLRTRGFVVSEPNPAGGREKLWRLA